MATDTDTSSSTRGPTRSNAAGRRRRSGPPRRPVFDKDQATLFLLTVTLGLGLGAVVRVVQRAQQAPTSAATQLTAQRSPTTGYGSYGSAGNQRAYVLPQRTFGARGTTRMS